MAHQSKWGDLPRQVLDLILHKIVIFPDYIRFGAVCQQWHFAALEHRQNRKTPMLPLLSMPTTDTYHILYSWENKVYQYQYPEIEGRFLGSSHGWLAFHGEEDSSITLLKPFSGRTLSLPPLIRPTDHTSESSSRQIPVLNAILSRDPSLHPNDYSVVAVIGEDITSSSLAFLKSGEQSWTYFLDPSFYVQSTCFCKGQLYAFTSLNNVIAIDNSGKATFVSMGPWKDADTDFVNSIVSAYLVESHDEELIMVMRTRDEYIHVCPGLRIDVYKMVKDDQGNADWVETKSLGDSAIFWSNDQCFCFSPAATDIPNIKRNSICRKNYTNGDLRVEAFDLASRQTEICYEVSDSRINGRTTFWILPTLS